MNFARLPLVMLVVFAGCTGPDPEPEGAAPPAPGAETAPDPPAPAAWRIVRDFNFTVTRAAAVPGTGTSHTSYEHLPYECTIFDLPGTVSKLTMWLNSTPDDLMEPSVGGVTFDLRHDDADQVLGFKRNDATLVAPRSYVLRLEGDLSGGYLANYKAENVAYGAHARVQIILEGESQEAGNPMSRCRDQMP